MRILCLTAWFPYPPDNGARMRTYYLLREMASQHEISLISFARQDAYGENTEALAHLCDILGIVSYRDYRPCSVRALLGFLSTYPRSLKDTHSSTMATLVHEALDQHQFDLVLASEIGPAIGTSQYVVDACSVPRVAEDLELSMIRSMAEAQCTLLGRQRHRLTWLKLRKHAVRLLRQIDGCTVASELERSEVLDIVPDYEPLAVVPNGVDISNYTGFDGAVDSDTLVFPGALTYKANFDAMAFFLEKVFPLIRVQRPAVQLYITGATTGVPLHRLPTTDGVVFTNYLEDVRPRIAYSEVCVVPMLMGGGTRFKILEALALGTPVVSTSKGAEGLEVTPEQDILTADDPRAFADGVLRLLGDASLRARLSRNGRALVRERYNWRVIGGRLNAFLEQVVGDWLHA